MISHKDEEEEIIPIFILSLSSENRSKYNPIKYRETDPLTPNSARVTVGIAVIIKNTRLMIINPCNKGISTENVIKNK